MILFLGMEINHKPHVDHILGPNNNYEQYTLRKTNYK
jgi:hypothetical protein